MWILKNSKELANLKAQNFSRINSIKTYDFATVYTTIPHDELKSRLLYIIDNCFFNKNGKRKYSYLVINHQKHDFNKYHSDSTHKYSEVETKTMPEFLINNIYIVVGGQVFQQSVGIPMGMNCAPLLADLFWYSYEAEFIQKLPYETKKSLAVTFSSTYINNNQFHSYVYLIYPNELEIKDTTECSTSASYLNVLLKLDTNSKIMTQLYDKGDDFNFSIVNFPYLCSNIPASPAYSVCVYMELNRYARACSTYYQFLVRGSRLKTS
jgi:hypothetical protein